MFIEYCLKWKEVLLREDDEFRQAKYAAQSSNTWFTSQNINQSIEEICNKYLDEEKLRKWLAMYPETLHPCEGVLGIVAAGNIPLVSFHDVLCAMACNQKVYFKPSSKDLYLTKYVYEAFLKLSVEFRDKIELVERLPNVDKCIITGSSVAKSHFEKYFKAKPLLVRSHRNSIALLNDSVSESELEMLSHDVFRYFGMGCRNVCKIYLPKLYPVEKIISVFDRMYPDLRANALYNSNYEYRHAVYLVNKQPVLQSGNAIWVESKQLAAPVAVIHYEFYDSINSIIPELEIFKEKIQCIVSNFEISDFSTIPFGASQCPELWDYQDNLDTMKFILQK